MTAIADVVPVEAIGTASIRSLLERYGLSLVSVRPRAPIPGSFWGAPEAGLIRDRLYARGDTPAHSMLHELGHFVCMSAARRAALDTDAGGDDTEECAVCYLQVLLADELTGYGRDRCLADMDRWGYSFREGSAQAWFHGDGREARDWLLAERLVDPAGQPSFRLRTGRGPPGQSLVGFGASP